MRFQGEGKRSRSVPTGTHFFEGVVGEDVTLWRGTDRGLVTMIFIDFIDFINFIGFIDSLSVEEPRAGRWVGE